MSRPPHAGTPTKITEHKTRSSTKLPDMPGDLRLLREPDATDEE
jgi:hypothetical protein